MINSIAVGGSYNSFLIWNCLMSTWINMSMTRSSIFSWGLIILSLIIMNKTTSIVVEGNFIWSSLNCCQNISSVNRLISRKKIFISSLSFSFISHHDQIQARDHPLFPNVHHLHLHRPVPMHCNVPSWSITCSARSDSTIPSSQWSGGEDDRRLPGDWQRKTSVRTIMMILVWWLWFDWFQEKIGRCLW